MVMQNVPGEIEDNSYATFVFLRERVGGGGATNTVLYGLRQNADIVTSFWKSMMCICGSRGEVGAKDEQTKNRLLKDRCMLNSTGIYHIT